MLALRRSSATEGGPHVTRFLQAFGRRLASRNGAGRTWGIIGFTLIINGEISSLLGEISGHDAGVLLQNLGPRASADQRMAFAKGRLDAARRQLRDSMSALERRRTIAQVVADSIEGQFKGDVLQRKMCIAQGRGIVHGANYDLAGWGLADSFAPPSP